MGILAWLGLEQRAVVTPDGETIPEPGVVPPARGEAFTTDHALSLSTVYRAIMILATGGSQLTVDVWRGEEQIDPKPALIRRPDVDASLSAFIEQTITSMAVSGDAYWQLTRNARNEVTNAVVLNPWECNEDIEKNVLHVASQTTPLTRTKYHHLKLLRVPGKAKGLGPIQACRLELEGAKDLRDFASDWFVSGDVPTGILKSDQVLTPAQAEQYKQMWQNRVKHEIAVLGSGLGYSPILLSPKDAQFIENQQFTTTGVARLFGIPAHLLLAAVEGSSMTYQNIAQADLAFIRWTLMKYLREIEEAFSALLPGTQTARFNLDALLRPDTKSRYEAHEIGLRARFLTVNEVRRMEGLPPVTGGDDVAPPAAPPERPAVGSGADSSTEDDR